MKRKKYYAFIAITFLGVILSNFALSISDLKSFIPVDIYQRYHWREKVSWLGNGILLSIIVWQSLTYENPEYSTAKKILILIALLTLDALVFLSYF